MSVTFIDRAQVGYRTDLPRRGHLVDPSRRTEIIHHHTVTIDHDTSPNVWENRDEILTNARRMQTIRPDLGLDVPYNVLIYVTPHGVTMVEGRGWARSGAHTAGHNTSGFGFGWVGDFRANLPDNWPDPVEQVAGWCRDHLRPTWVEIDEVHGHKDFKNTDCPGQVYAQLGIFRRVFFAHPQPSEVEMILKLGATGNAVRLFQRCLNRQGAGGGMAADGIFGTATEAAVRRYQQAANVPQTGQIDGLTAALLSRYDDPTGG